jgi:hypothetical protein
MIPLLAQSTPPAAALSSFLEVAFYLIGIVTAAVVLWKQLTGKSEETRITPQPLEVKPHARLAKWEELETVKNEAHGRISRERKEIDAAIARVEAQQKELGAQIDSDLQAIRDQVAGNNEASEQRVERINRRLDDLNTSVSGLPAQVVSLINNAKAI